jgi:ATP-dependent protease ClpP protease subunit
MVTDNMAKSTKSAGSKQAEESAPGSKATEQSSQSKSIFSDCAEALQTDDDERLKRIITSKIEDILKLHNLTGYSTLFLFDDINLIADYHADQIYAGASKTIPNTEDFLLIVNSKGGRIEPAYLISKTLKRLSLQKFAVAIPRRAKSAATLIALGADEIHMGMMSQLGPIDPQFGGIPALALQNALDTMASLACKFPDASTMLTNYLAQQIPLRMLGYYQRVTESAEQYAERLLGNKPASDELDAKSIAKHLVHHYKDHSFVIDFDEASSLLGKNMVKQATPEYRASDEIFRFLDFVSIFADFHDKQLSLVGDLQSGIWLRRKPTDKSGKQTSKLTTD